MQKEIAKVSPMAMGHLMLEFEDGAKQMVHRGDHEAHQPKAGDMWPPDGHKHVTSGRPAHSERRSNMAGNLKSIEIFPGENGEHRVVHNFKRESGKKEGSIRGALSDAPDPQLS